MLPVVIKTFVLSIFEWPFYTGFIVLEIYFLSPIKKYNEMVLLSAQNTCLN